MSAAPAWGSGPSWQDGGLAPRSRRPATPSRSFRPNLLPTSRRRPSGGPSPMGEHARRSGQDAPAPADEPDSGFAAPGASQTSQLVSAPLATAAPVSQETSSADGAVIIPPAASLEEAGRLPIFASVESHWFRGGRTTPGSSGPAAVPANHWSSPADEGWQAADDGRLAVLERLNECGTPQAAAEREPGPGNHPERATRRPAEPVRGRGPQAARRTSARCQRRPGRGQRSGERRRGRRVLRSACPGGALAPDLEER